MNSIASIGRTGMQAAQLRLDASANNVANMNTPDYRRVKVEQQAAPEGAGVQASASRSSTQGVGLEQEVVEQMSATYAFKASLQTVKVADQLMGSLLDVRA